MTSDFYTYHLTDRRRMLADAGFARDELRIWSHPDGRAIGEGVAAALTDEAFLRFLRAPNTSAPADETSVEGEEVAQWRP